MVSLSSRSSAGRTANKQGLGIWALSITFLAGCFIGHLHGSLTSSSSNPCLDLRQQLQPNDDDANKQSASITTRDSTSSNNGWHSIEVFYGDTNHFRKTLEENRVWFSQANQDQAIHALFRGKRNGFFVDLAANDATILSNTYALENELGWNGLCIEPNPLYWKNLTYRNCQVVAAVVGKTRMETLPFRFEAGPTGGIAGEGFDNNRKFVKQSTPTYTVPLLEILERFNVPKNIDYLSLDVEGAEEFIMSNFPLDVYTISVLTVERPTDKLKEIFEKYSYKSIMRLHRLGETLWAHESVMDSLDVETVRANFDPKKLRAQEKQKEEAAK